MDDAKKGKLIELLNEALQVEYTDIFLYPKQSEVIKEKEISEKFEKFGKMELRHADNIAMQILTLGGKPHWNFTFLDTKESIDEILQGHLDREAKNIQLYKNIIEFVDDIGGEDQLKVILEGIRSEEESHLGAIKVLIQKRK